MEKVESLQEPLMDSLGRRFNYLRLSITDVCNYQCSYCLPNGYKKEGSQDFLTAVEIERLIRALSELGLSKIRLTGGEPTVRADFLDIARRISAINGIKKLALTTNGYRLADRAEDIYNAGIRSINVSIDSLQPAMFHKITGQDRLDDALKGIEACIAAGMDKVKINTVLLKNLNSLELPAFLDFVKNRPVALRFIELMRTKDNAAYFADHHLSGAVLTRHLLEYGWQASQKEENDGPAIEYWNPDYQGRVGLIAPYSKDFCASCNRLRVSSRGDLHLCLFGEGGISLRKFLVSDDQKDDLKSFVQNMLGQKNKGHSLWEGYSGKTRHLASIGG